MLCVDDKNNAIFFLLFFILFCGWYNVYHKKAVVSSAFLGDEVSAFFEPICNITEGNVSSEGLLTSL